MYHIREDYIIREDNEQFDDTPFTDEWQDGVYAKAHAIAMEHGLGSVLDVGCGSGFKLMKHFRHFSTCGVEVEPTLSWLKSKYPDRLWCSADQVASQYGLVICSDVIEHVHDPDALISAIRSVAPRYVVISTPDRSMLNCDQQGPPRNLAHVREWSFDEFGPYMSSHFEVLEHFIVNKQQCTQVVVARVY